jgi:hypothetical protein
MNEATIRVETGPEVSAFVGQVRARLSDLSDEEREELVGGLEADIAELVSDGGTVSELGDPRAYADELRAAAGIERPTGAADATGAGFLGVRRLRRPVARRVDASLDGARRRWFELVEVPALRTTWDFLTTLRPVWWVLRAWVAVQLLDLTTQGGDLATPVPTLGGPLLGSLVWLVAIVVSVQIGRGAIWPGSGAARTALARVVLLALNAFAILMTPVVLGQFPASGTWEYHDLVGSYEPNPGLMNRGEWVQNVFPFDAQGQPLTGVQLFDQDGNPLNVARFAGDEFNGGQRTVVYPWLNGEKRLYNVFPLPRREQDSRWAGVRPDAWTSPNPPYLPTPPLAVVPPVALPGIEVEPTDQTADEATEPDATTDTGRTERSGTEATGERSDSEKPAGR